MRVVPFFTALQLQGPEAVAFLHRITCNEVNGLPIGQASFNALCSPKGRIISLFWQRRDAEDALTLFVDAENAEVLHTHLVRYRLRQKVEIARAPAPVLWDEQNQETLRLHLGDAGDSPEASADAFWLTFITCGWPWVLAPNREAFLPQWLNLDLIGGVSFTKGCYPGQEVIARTKYLGEVKKRMGRVRGRGMAPAAGTACFGEAFGAQESGRVVLSAATGDGVFEALVSVQRALLDAGAMRLGAPDGTWVEVLSLPYSLEVQE